ncbi:MAG: DUF4445 domain-containing protein [Lachnospiraceae bacterium]|nr:DUF4445 domain-containing protein [Lachnospiraceae bacterium]
MKDIRIISGKRIAPSMETVCMLLGYKEYLGKQTEVETLYEKLLQMAKMHIRPKAALAIENGYLFVMLTLGSGISRCIERYTKKGDMLSATVLDAMADSCLFAFEEQLLPMLQQIVLAEGYGIERRLEAPMDIPIKMQKEAYDILDAKRTLGLSMTNGYMLDPVKSMCLIFQLTEDVTCQNLHHDCTRCENTTCALRKKEVALLRVEYEKASEEGVVQIQCQKGSNLSEILQKNGILLPTFCGGNGTCGKCGIRVKEGNLQITPEDRTAFSKEELQNGMRLSCKAVIEDNLTIILKAQEDKFTALGSEENSRIKVSDKSSYKKGDLAIAIDIGTTTLAFSLLDLKNGRILDSHTALNSQKSCGADVISRIQAANAGKKAQLQKSIQTDIQSGLEILLKRSQNLFTKPLQHIVIAANTVMLHLLRGYDCMGFCSYPFKPVTLALEEITLGELLKIPMQNKFLPETTKVTLLPGISAFVGADITAGLFACEKREEKAHVLFLDLGTNGEMALKVKDKIFVASTAAGPAFEGGNIRYGMGSIAGAIAKVSLNHYVPQIETIKNQPPEGICGTGVIEAVAELLRAGFMDKNGKLTEEYFTEGYPLAENLKGEKIVLLQQDIRKIQMAKAAIRAGIEILFKKAGICCNEVERVYLAGGFGYYLDIEKAAYIGIFPKELVSKTCAVGNAALTGAMQFLVDEDKKRLEEIIENTEEIQLAEVDDFHELYMNYINF